MKHGRTVCFAGAALLALGRQAAPAAAEQRPNILFILTDDQRFDAIAAAGCAEISTPAMDKLASEGTFFTQASIMGGNSAAVCMPSRSMLLTGASLFRCRGVIPKGFTTLPEALRRDGYATFVTGKWHNDNDALLRSFEFGSAVFRGGMGDHFRTPVDDIREGVLTGKRQETEFDAEVFADATIDFLKTRPKNKPFFAFLSFKTPHDPRVVPAKFHRMYDSARITLPPNFLPEHPFDNGEKKIRDELLAKFPRSPEEIREHLAAYYAATTATDEQIGRVLDALRDLGLDKSTVVVFTGDNGLAVGQHGLMGKQNLYDHSIRVPLILRGPGIPAGKRTDALCQLSDLCPTLCAMAGTATPKTADGKDLGPVVRGEADGPRDATLHCYKDIQRAVRTRDAKLIEYLVKGRATTQLFDLKRDPREMKNLADDPAHADLLKTMRARLGELEKEFSAPQLGVAADSGAPSHPGH